MRRLLITASEAELPSHAGLGLIGMALNECTDLAANFEVGSPLRSDAMPHANIIDNIAVIEAHSEQVEEANAVHYAIKWNTHQ